MGKEIEVSIDRDIHVSRTVKSLQKNALEDLWERRGACPGEEEITTKRDLYQAFLEADTDELGSALVEVGYIKACDEIFRLLMKGDEPGESCLG